MLLVDKPNWIFDECARALKAQLCDEFEFSIHYVVDDAVIDASAFDLVYVFFWGEEKYRRMNIRPERLVMHVASHRWEDDPRYGPCTPRAFAWRYLRDCNAVHCTSKRLAQTLEGLHSDITVLPSGYAPGAFYPSGRRGGALSIGWAGNVRDDVKEVDSILRPACAGTFTLHLASGEVPKSRMNAFYNGCDVIAVTSRHEGHPMPLIEGMAAGCFPVTTDVGIVPDVIRHGDNGLIVERDPRAFREAFRWCAKNISHVREAGVRNAGIAKRRFSWPVLEPMYRAMFRRLVAASSAPKFRNDDVSGDTPMGRFREFCEVFWKHGCTQIHGVTLKGRTCDFSRHGTTPTPYPGVAPLSELPNQTIRDLACDVSVADHRELVAFLRTSPDEIALHGLYHTDHSVMSEAELRRDFTEALAIMQTLFPGKLVRYFIPPFNRISPTLARVCREFGLHPLGTEGVHLEAEINTVMIEASQWYRYHHHRFYPESTCGYYPTNMRTLDAALGRRAAIMSARSEVVA